MPQTLLALLALMLSSLLVFNQQRLTTQSQTRMVTDEVELAASGLMSDILEFAEARSFDETTTPSAIEIAQIVPGTPTLFSASARFGLGTSALPGDRGTAGCNLLQPGLRPECDDLDDLDGLTAVPVDILLANGRRFPFTATISVMYVTNSASMTPATSPTLHKRITVSIRSAFVRRGLADVNQATRVISYDPIKTAKDHEDVYGPIGT